MSKQVIEFVNDLRDLLTDKILLAKEAVRKWEYPEDLDDALLILDFLEG